MTTPIELLRTAKDIYGAFGVSSAARRAVISRAYYSVFHYLGQKYFPEDYNQKGGAHEILATRLLAVPIGQVDLEMQAARENIRSLLADRVRADYQLNNPIEKWQAELAIARAAKIFIGKPR